MITNMLIFPSTGGTWLDNDVEVDRKQSITPTQLGDIQLQKSVVLI